MKKKTKQTNRQQIVLQLINNHKWLLTINAQQMSVLMFLINSLIVLSV